jgi:RsiW-degrading membrane proteinase PrsW (M82 family)
MISVLERIPMKHLVGIGVLIALAFVLRSWLHPNLGLDIYVHDAYWAIPLGVVAFWCLIGTALTWLVVFAWTSVRRHS